MTVEEALAFLSQHQPMPSDRDAPDGLFDRYNQVRRYFQEHPDVRCLSLFLGSFGNGNGRGNYQLVEDVFRRFGAADAIPRLNEALTFGTSAARYWAAQIACIYRSTDLVDGLAVCLRDRDPAVRYMAVVCLEQIGDAKSKEALRCLQNVESEKDIMELLEDVLGDTPE
jgi:hypothetical protein